MLTNLPALVAHADWGSDPKKRWMAFAVLQKDGNYLAHSPEPVGDLNTLIECLQVRSKGGTLMMGVDFPIGLPRKYAEKVKVDNFLELLPQLGAGEWQQFYRVAEKCDEINLYRPFYPERPGHTRRCHLEQGLGLNIADLRRVCECEVRKDGHLIRRAACPLFWTLGGQQVGKAAIIGWREVLSPALKKGYVAIWPFSGHLEDLFDKFGVVITETYPTEFYTHFGEGLLGFSKSKRNQGHRKLSSGLLLSWAENYYIKIDHDLRKNILGGFGSTHYGEDKFDATVGLFGMLDILLREEPFYDPEDRIIENVEGWIFGQARSEYTPCVIKTR